MTEDKFVKLSGERPTINWDMRFGDGSPQRLSVRQAVQKVLEIRMGDARYKTDPLQYAVGMTRLGKLIQKDMGLVCHQEMYTILNEIVINGIASPRDDGDLDIIFKVHEYLIALKFHEQALAEMRWIESQAGRDAQEPTTNKRWWKIW